MHHLNTFKTCREQISRTKTLSTFCTIVFIGWKMMKKKEHTKRKVGYKNLDSKQCQCLKRDGYNHIQKNNCADMTLSTFFLFYSYIYLLKGKKRKRKSTLLEFWSEIKWLSQAQFHHRGTEQRHKKNSNNNKNKKNVWFFFHETRTK